MDTKLTIKLDSSVIDRAKIYAKKKNTSLSQLIENYLGILIDPKDDHSVTPLVKSISGILDIPKDFDVKKSYKKHILNKYSK